MTKCNATAAEIMPAQVAETLRTTTASGVSADADWLSDSSGPALETETSCETSAGNSERGISLMLTDGLGTKNASYKAFCRREANEASPNILVAPFRTTRSNCQGLALSEGAGQNFAIHKVIRSLLRPD